MLSIQLYTSNRNDSIVQPLFDVGADFQVHSHHSSKSHKTLEDIINDANASDSGSSSSASETSTSSDESDDLLDKGDELLSVIPKVHLPEPPGSAFSEESDDSEYHSFISDQNELSKIVVANSNKSSASKLTGTSNNKDPLSHLDDDAKAAIQVLSPSWQQPTANSS